MNVTPQKPSLQEIDATVIRLAAAQVAVDPALVTLETRFREDLDYDSIDTMDFIMTLEETFELSIPDEQAEQVRTVGEAAGLVRASGAAGLE